MKVVFLTVAVLLPAFLSASSQPLSSCYRVDIDGDGNEEVITYSISKNVKDYDVSLKITSKDSSVLWSHNYSMTENDLTGDLLMNEGDISLEHWVNHFFDSSLIYGAKFQKYKINANDIRIDYLEFYSDKYGVSKEKLREYILAPDTNNVFYYRASWREDLVMLVYVPEIQKLIRFSSGY